MEGRAGEHILQLPRSQCGEESVKDALRQEHAVRLLPVAAQAQRTQHRRQHSAAQHPREGREDGDGFPDREVHGGFCCTRSFRFLRVAVRKSYTQDGRPICKVL